MCALASVLAICCLLNFILFGVTEQRPCHHVDGLYVCVGRGKTSSDISGTGGGGLTNDPIIISNRNNLYMYVDKN